MLSSIHPLGERSRGNRWTVTVTIFVVASTLGGAMLGAAAGLIGVGAVALGVPRGVLLTIALVAAAAGALVDATRWPSWLWRPHRQVDENWLQAYRGWVYGAGFGVQLGVGFATIVTAASLYVTVLAAVASASLVGGLVIGSTFGAVRGATLFAGRTIRSTDELFAFHRRMARRLPAVRALSVLGCAAVALAGAGVLLGQAT